MLRFLGERVAVTMNELYLPPVAPRWARTRDLVAALGCSVVRADRGRWVGDAPQDAQLLRGGRIYFPAGERLSSRAWAHIAHEAVEVPHRCGDQRGAA